MNEKTQLRRGLIGSVLAAICCFTPLLVVVVTGAGLSAIVGWLDYALFPLLFASLGLVAHALWLMSQKRGPSPKGIITLLVLALSVLLIWLEFRFALRISVAAALAVALYGYWLRRGAAAQPGPSDTF